MILCVGANPALDRTLLVPSLRVGEVNRAESVLVQAGGKAANVARVLTRLGTEATLVGPLGGPTGDEAKRLAEREGLITSWTYSDAETRVCTAVVTPGGTVTDINEPGRIDADGWRDLLAQVAELSSAARLILISGSLPAGGGPYADLVQATGSTPVWVDTGGPGLASLRERSSVGLIKVNRSEAIEALGLETRLSDPELASQLSSWSGSPVVVTLGAEGAVFADGADAVLVASPQPRPLVNPTGSGDAFLAGLAYAHLERGESVADALSFAAACGASNAAHLGAGQIDPTSL